MIFNSEHKTIINPFNELTFVFEHKFITYLRYTLISIDELDWILDLESRKNQGQGLVKDFFDLGQGLDSWIFQTSKNGQLSIAG